MDSKSSIAIARNLLEIKAVQIRLDPPFTWASGLFSPVYCDNRLILSQVQVRNYVKVALTQLSSSFEKFDSVAGVATAGIPHGALLADALSLPFVYVRSSAKSHGRQNKVEGSLPAGSHCLVVEDLISTGGSSLEACATLKSQGWHVVGVIGIFTYGFPSAHARFEEAGIPYQTLTNFSTLLQVATHDRTISPDQESLLQQWIHDPTAWSETMKNRMNSRETT